MSAMSDSCARHQDKSKNVGAFDTLEKKRAFMRLPMEQRGEILRRQAERMAPYYEETKAEQEIWQGGDIMEYD